MAVFFTGEAMVFKAKPARKIGRARLAKAAKDAVGPRGLSGDSNGPVFEDRPDRHSAIVASPVARPAKLHRRLGRSDRRYGPTLYPERIVQAAASGLGAPLARALARNHAARVRWSTLGYVEKVRPQFLSLRHASLISF